MSVLPPGGLRPVRPSLNAGREAGPPAGAEGGGRPTPQLAATGDVFPPSAKEAFSAHRRPRTLSSLPRCTRTCGDGCGRSPRPARLRLSSGRAGRQHLPRQVPPRAPPTSRPRLFCRGGPPSQPGARALPGSASRRAPCGTAGGPPRGGGQGPRGGRRTAAVDGGAALHTHPLSNRQEQGSVRSGGVPGSPGSGGGAVAPGW